MSCPRVEITLAFAQYLRSSESATHFYTVPFVGGDPP